MECYGPTLWAAFFGAGRVDDLFGCICVLCIALDFFFNFVLVSVGFCWVVSCAVFAALC